MAGIPMANICLLLQHTLRHLTDMYNQTVQPLINTDSAHQRSKCLAWAGPHSFAGCSFRRALATTLSRIAFT